MTVVTEAIKKIVEPMIKTQVIRGEVVSVDKNKHTCVIKPLRGGANYLDVKLDAIVGSDVSRLILYPKVESTVFIAIIEGNQADTFVTKVSEVESIVIKIENDFSLEVRQNGELEVRSSQIRFNGGQLGGLVKVNELTTQLTKNNTLLQAIQNAFINWVPVGGDGGAALKVLSTSFAALPKGDYTNLANNDIKQ